MATVDSRQSLLNKKVCSEMKHSISGQKGALDDENSNDATRADQHHSSTAFWRRLSSTTKAWWGPLSRAMSQRWRASPMSTWWQEVLAAGLLLAAPIASFSTLYPHHGQTLPEWPYSISIPTLLSIYSVVLRLAATFLLAEGISQLKWRWFNKSAQPLRDMVLHDNASRGPVGAIELLWRLPAHSTWQWMGSLLIVGTLLVGPFTQQVAQYEECSVKTDSVLAHIPRSSFFIMNEPILSGASPRVSIEQEVAINTGIVTPGTTTTHCSSGNCTFEVYSSLGYCTRCEDISSRIQVINHDPDMDRYSINTTSSIPDGISMDFWMSLVTSSGQPTQGRPEGPRSNLATCGVTSEGMQILIGLPSYLGPYWKNITKTEQPSFDDCQVLAEDQKWRCQGYGAANCAMYPCVRTFNTTSTNGILREEVINTRELLNVSTSEWYSRTDGGRRVFAGLIESCLNDQERSKLRYLGYSLEFDTDKWLLPYALNSTYNVTFDRAELIALEQGFVDRGCLYALDTYFPMQLRDFMSNLCGNMTATLGPYRYGSRVLNNYRGPQLLQNVYNYGGFSIGHTQSLFDNISISLSNSMLQISGQTFSKWVDPPPTMNLEKLVEPAHGIAWTTKICVQVRWPWLILPSSLALLTLVFFVGVLTSSHELPKDVRTWKTSPLPFMFYGPGGRTGDQNWAVTESQHVDDLNATASKTYVSLVQDESGLVSFRRRGGLVDDDMASLTSASDAV